MEAVTKGKTACKAKYKQPNTILRQLVVCVISWSFYFMFGLSMGAPTVIVPQLRNQANCTEAVPQLQNQTNCTEAVSPVMASWITSILGYSGMVWVIILTIAVHYIGRKKCWILAAANSLAAFIFLYCSTNVIQIFIAQLMQGFTGAAQTTVSVMIITECSSPKHRGLFLTLKSASFFWGLWMANAIGTFFHYKYIGLLGIVCSVYNLATIFFIPESPYWLAFKGRYEECAKAHRWLKGCNEDSEKELEILIQSQKEMKSTAKTTLLSHCRTYVRTLFQPEFYKPTALCLLVQAMYYLSGKLVYAVYAIEILKNITKSKSTAYTAMLILDGFSVVGMYVGCFIARIIRRRTLLFVCSVTATIFLYVISLYLYLVKLNLISENNVITISLLIVFSLAICCGPMILTTSISGELYPVKARGFSICFVSFMAKFYLGTTLKVSPFLFETFDFHGTFFVYGIASAVCIVLVYKYVPETKDKTLQEIALIFEKKKKSYDTTELKLLQKS